MRAEIVSFGPELTHTSDPGAQSTFTQLECDNPQKKVQMGCQAQGKVQMGHRSEQYTPCLDA